jgi:methylmalonyl-CoA mutase
MARFNPKDPKSSMLRTHVQTSGWSLSEQDPYNNIIRTTLEALAAVFGGAQSLHTNSFDEAVGLPTDFSARIARNTQTIIQEESQVCHVVDPLGGSYYVESLTNGMITEARKIIVEIEELGGMAKAIETGMPKLRIEESAARKQARIDQGTDVIVGVNKYRIEEEPLKDILEVSDTVRDEQIERLKQIRTKRDRVKVRKALNKVTDTAKGNGNLLAASIEAIKARATVGEVSLAMEKVFGRFTATTVCLSGIYTSEYSDKTVIDSIRKRCDDVKKEEGRRPRILLTKMGQDGHDRGVKVVATAFADFGFDVDISPMFQTPKEAAKMALENDVHIVGVSSLAAGHRALVPKLIDTLKQAGEEDILVVVGGVIPPNDYAFLKQAGVMDLFGPGTSLIDSAKKILFALEQKRVQKDKDKVT